ncbi:MAG: aminoglycoside phosphotransferase (APT) family kinase protein [Candidatus Azotimanducaceae bacterium]|jgi:aminoglycoside phosphotransferase (APT) family kinase protein
MSVHDESQGPEGYDVAKVESWIAANIKEITTPLQWLRLEGGHSNLTYQITDANGFQSVIRRPPQGELLPKAHDMSREWALISALQNTDVPVPAALGFCESPDVTGAWFYVMGHIDGHPLYNSEDTELWVPEDQRAKMAFHFIDVLAALHRVDPDEVGLGDLGKKDSYVARQLKTWYRSWTSSVEPANYDDPRAHELQQFFLDNLPDQGPARVVHGDYGPHNVLTGSDCTIHAVVDWEISTLGDPLADLAYALNFFPDPSDAEPPLPEAAFAPPGFPSRTEIATRYAQASGRDLSNIDYYIGFNRWKSAAIIHGVYARYCEGKKSTEGIDMDEMRERIGRILGQAEDAVNRLAVNRL